MRIMNFCIRKAVSDDIPQIMKIMYAAPSGDTKPEWYITDEESSVRSCLDEKGCILVAETESSVMAGFFIVRYPDREENLGKYLDFSESQLQQVALMDSVAIVPDFRGYGLQKKLVEEAERRIDREKYHYLMCTIHPDNHYSLANMEKSGYTVRKTVECYGGNIRHVLLKEV